MASLFYTYYKRTDVKSDENRPLIISFNGGPGSASVWMHIAYTGPQILKIDDEGYPIQPYGIKTNPYSVLDIADILYVNPVNTGYSRMVKDAEGKYPDRKKFFGINADIEYLAEWINTFVTRNNRWRSPKYLIGESYGGTRVAGLALELQDKQWMYLNGVIMVSPADYQFLYKNSPVSSAINLPYFTAAAWYHKALSSDLQQKDLLEVLPEVEKFAIDELLPALTQGGFLDEKTKDEIATKMSRYSGLSKASILQHNLDVPTNFFWKELKRENGFNIGRLDSRYLGIDRKEAGTSPDYSAELTSWLHSFTPAINYYIREHLNYKTDIKYELLSSAVHPWDRTNDNTRENLRQAMAQNPYLNVMFQSGYYDGATTYFGAKYTMWQIDPSGKMKDRFEFHGYRSGHMMYLRSEDLETSNQDIRNFIKKTMPKAGESAKY
ncbi:S10 family peptidase [Urechidicola croceus]|uniref:S10 family peptidase n=1 Tax=Urechidicola croceus TaxID=1850246 RepID=UPI0038B55C1F